MSWSDWKVGIHHSQWIQSAMIYWTFGKTWPSTAVKLKVCFVTTFQVKYVNWSKYCSSTGVVHFCNLILILMLIVLKVFQLAFCISRYLRYNYLHVSMAAQCNLTNSSDFASDSPMHTLLPVPKGLKLGGIPVNLPSASRNRDGSNLWGSFQCLWSCNSSWRFGQTWVPFGMLYSPWVKNRQ